MAEPHVPLLRRLRWLWTELLIALAVAATVAAAGAPLALLWTAVAPKVQIVMTDGGAFHTEPEPEGYIGGEGVFVIITLAAGLVAAIVTWLVVNRRRGPIVLAGLALGSVGGALLMAWIGHRIGLSDFERLLKEAPVGARFERPVDVRGDRSAIPVQAVSAVAAYTLLAAFSIEPTLRRVAKVSSHWSTPQAPPAVPAPPASTAAASAPD